MSGALELFSGRFSATANSRGTNCLIVRSVYAVHKLSVSVLSKEIENTIIVIKMTKVI